MDVKYFRTAIAPQIKIALAEVLLLITHLGSAHFRSSID
jgi:hypothetical protein